MTVFERNIVLLHGEVIDISATMAALGWDSVQYNLIFSSLRFDLVIDWGIMIDMGQTVYTLDQWLLQYGVRSTMTDVINLINEDDTVGTWDLTDDELSLGTVSDNITDEDEEEMVIGANIIMTMIQEDDESALEFESGDEMDGL